MSHHVGSPDQPYRMTEHDGGYRAMFGKVYEYFVNTKTGRLSLRRAKAPKGTHAIKVS